MRGYKSPLVSSTRREALHKAEHLAVDGANWPTRKIVGLSESRPCTCYCACLAFLMLLTMAVAGPNLMTFSDAGQHDWTVTSSAQSEHADMISYATEVQDDVTDSTGAASVTKERSEMSLMMTTTFIYEWSDARNANIFTPETLKEMCTLENILMNHPLYPERCLLDYNVAGGKNCTVQRQSIVHWFYGQNHANFTTEAGHTGWFCVDLDQSHIDTRQALLQTKLKTAPLEVGVFMGKGAEAAGFTRITRSVLMMGAPLKGFNSATDRAVEQQAAQEEIMFPVRDALQARFGMESTYFKSAFVDPSDTKGMKVRFYSFAFQQGEFQVLVNGDLTYTLLSIMFVFSYIWLHTGTLWLASTGMLQIVLSLPVAFFIYRLIFQITFFTQLHILVIFLVLGIGADDTFVFVDAWKQSFTVSKSQYIRLMFAYRRTASAVFNTSFTTAVAFVSTAISPIMPVSSFGIYATLAIVLNYVFVITLTPASVIIWHRYFSGPCCSCFKQTEFQPETEGDMVVKGEPVEGDAAATDAAADDNAEATEAAEDVTETETPVAADDDAGTAAAEPDLPGSPTQSVGEAAADADADADAEAREATATDGTAAADGDKLEVEEIPTNEEDTKEDDGADADAEIGENALVTGTTASGDDADNTEQADAADAAKETTTTTTEDEDENQPAGAGAGAGAAAAGDNVGVLIMSPPLQDYEDDTSHLRRSEKFFYGPYSSALNFRWKGVKVISLAIVVALVAYMILSITWASKLSTPTEEEQWFPDSHMFTGIGDFQTQNFVGASDDDFMEITFAWGMKDIDRSEFNLWEPNENRGKAVWDEDFDLSKVDSQQALLAACDAIKAFKCSAPGCTQDTLMLNPNEDFCFIKAAQTYSGGTLPTGSAFFTKMQDFRKDNSKFANDVGFVGGKLRFVTMSFKSSLLKNQPFGTTDPVREETERLAEELRKTAPDGMKSVIHTAFWWVWTQTEQGLVNGMWTGFAVCFPVAFIVLIVATHNVILASVAIVTIMSIVAGVLGAAQAWMGWSLGIGESIAAVIVIGFSVDYVLHLGHMYTDKLEMHPDATRDECLRHSATTMGVTVVAGAATTFGAGIFMLLCQLTFFTKMAVLITFTIAFSFLYSLGMFMAAAALVGPTGKTGNVVHMFKRLRASCGGKPVEDTPSDSA